MTEKIDLSQLLIKDDNRYQTLVELCEKNQEFHIEYMGYRANHMTDGLIALYGMGLKEDRLRDFYKDYAKRRSLEPSRDPDKDMGKLTKENFQNFLGSRKGYVNFLQFFKEEYNKNGQNIKVLLNEHFPYLIKGASHAALHPLIHIGFGLTYKIDITVLEGLAFQCYEYMEIDHHTKGYESLIKEGKMLNKNYNSITFFELIGNNFKDLQNISSYVRKAKDRAPYCQIFPGGDFLPAMICLSFEFQKQLYKLDLQLRLESLEETEISQVNPIKAHQELMEIALFLYAISGNDFFILHIVTSCFALGRILPLIEDKNVQILSLRYLIKYALSVWIVQGIPGVEIIKKIINQGDFITWKNKLIEEGDSGKYSWEDLKSMGASKSEEEHTHKLVFVCYEESLLNYFDEKWLKHVAWKRVSAGEEGNNMIHKMYPNISVSGLENKH
jgi:hypothetical protein